MKKLFALLLALALVGSIALADPASLTGCSVSSGVVNAVNYIDITAPFSGTLQPFTWEAGDLVNAGDLLFSMRTTPIYATEDATVQAIDCAAGDDATAVATRYGGLIAMRPESEWVIAGSITTAYDKRDNRVVDVGDFQPILHHAQDPYTRLLVEKRADVMRRYRQVLAGKEQSYA